jgi:hypothetical protein
VYRPVPVIVPVEEFPAPDESTDHVTFTLLEPATVAVNCCCAPGWSVRDEGVSCMVTGPVEFVDGGVFLYAAHPMEGARMASRRNPLQKVDSVAHIRRVSR